MRQRVLLHLIWVGLYSLLVCSCVNSIETNEDIEKEESQNYPILLKDAVLQKYVYDESRILKSGLFVLPNRHELDEERLIDNIPCLIGLDGISPENGQTYPNEKDKFTFVSYFPFQKEKIPDFQCSMNISVSDKQNVEENFLLSDFMVAKKEDIVASKKTVLLSHQHELAQLSVSIEYLGEDGLGELLKQNPSVLFNKMFTNGVYHFDTEECELTGSVKDIVPHGIWKAEGTLLTGKEAIVMPQTLVAGTEIATLTVNGKTYSCRISENFILQKGKNNRITIQYHPTKGIGAIWATINNWEEGSSTEITPEERIETEYIDISVMSLVENPVYNVYHKGEKVAEVCMEYLNGQNMNGRAIVSYPIKDGAVDLTNGTVLEVLENDRLIHGGKVSWNIKDNSLFYQEGCREPIRRFYVDTAGQICMEKPQHALLLYVEPMCLTDIRGEEANKYAVVKIGIQYWMKKNLATRFYNDNSKIPQKTGSNYTKTSAGFFVNDGNLFYNKSAVNTGKLSPVGWHVPTVREWDLLKQYIGNNASVLKQTGMWESEEWDATNLTGFDAVPIGIYTKSKSTDKSVFDFKGEFVGLWVYDNVRPELADYAIILSNSSGILGEGTYSDYSGYSIRCIKD